MRPAVSYIPCAEYSKEKTGGIITFAQFEEGDLLSETHEIRKAMTKAVTNPITIQLFHNYLEKKNRMLWILSISQIMILCLQRCYKIFVT